VPGSEKMVGKDYRDVVTFGGGNGLSYNTAIIIHARDQISGFGSEFAYIKGHFRDYPYVMKERREVHNNKTYDVVTLASYNWQCCVVYFDVSEFVKKK